MKKEKGKVYLVGSGPGDPDLITLKAIEALKKADVVLYDYLSHPSLLSYVSSFAVCICVGKKKDFHSKKQWRINQIMLKFARQGKRIVRLKGGDPVVFGRGGEEMDFLRKYEIPYEVIPGVTSAFAVPIYSGIPITYRRLSRTAAILTGTFKKGSAIAALKIPEVDTLIILMGVTHLESLVLKIASSKGFSLKTPAALLYRGTTAEEKKIVGTLATIVQQQRDANISPPAILMVGQVVKVSKKLEWRNALPLSKTRIVLLRERQRAWEWASAFSELGAEVVIFPLLETRLFKKNSLKLTPQWLSQFDDVVFTSKTAVRFFMDALLANGGDSRTLAGKRLLAIGEGTEATLNQAGLRADSIAKESRGEGVVDLFPQDCERRRVLYPAAKGARGVIESELRKKGARVTRFLLYKTARSKSKTFLVLKEGDIVIFTSPSTVDHFIQSGIWQNQAIIPVCLGPVTLARVQKYGMGTPVLCEKPTLQAAVSSVLSFLNSKKTF